MPPTDFLVQTGAAAFSSGPDGTIQVWNKAAEGLLALNAADVIGRRCGEVISGRDVFGNEFCSPQCTCRQMACLGHLIQPFHLATRDGRGHPLMVRVTILVTQEGESGPTLLHLLEPLVPNGMATVAHKDHRDLQKLSKIGPEFLTGRELEVMRCLAQGLGTSTIADQLQISKATVRNHVAKCLKKLGAHSRLEATTIARQLKIV